MSINQNNNTSIIITKQTVTRLLKDVKEIMTNPLTSHGIYYMHDEVDMLKGKALIIGPSNTPYEHGFYLFDFTFPTNYPHSPPKVEYYTNDGFIRFNPNLYTNGKVCLSVLNTWSGEQWSGCQTITSVLLALCTVLNDSPLLNEPGLKRTHMDFNNYNAILTYKNIDFAIHGVLIHEQLNERFVMFSNIMQKYFLTNYDKIMEIVNKNLEKYPEPLNILTVVYNMSVKINYNALKSKLQELKENIEKMITE
jgi:ubiquitin-conjugating enzyme E2 Z